MTEAIIHKWGQSHMTETIVHDSRELHMTRDIRTLLETITHDLRQSYITQYNPPTFEYRRIFNIIFGTVKTAPKQNNHLEQKIDPQATSGILEMYGPLKHSKADIFQSQMFLCIYISLLSTL
uniref:Uncharacterized protein n=1 Tax=Arion vulgaris TaxID=1028688 RepID=A0A0B7BYE2_9EUPU